MTHDSDSSGLTDPRLSDSQEEANLHPIERPHLPAGKTSISRLALEAAMIAFGVLLALSLESWSEHRKEAARAHEALVNIRKEIAGNVEQVRQQIPRQEQVVEALRAYEDSLGAGKKASGPHIGLYPPFLSSAAWSTAMSTQALAHMELGTVQKLAAFYDARRWLDRIEDTWLRLMTEPRLDTQEANQQWASTLRYTMAGYIEIENVILQQAEQATSGEH